MTAAMAVAAGFLFIVALLSIVTRFGASWIERKNPPVGTFAKVNNTRVHYVHLPALAGSDMPPMLFVHGASGNLKDQMLPVRPLLEGRAELVFVDRPGHGWSGRGPAANDTPFGQAGTIAGLLDHLRIEKAIMVGHSYGGAIAASFALASPERTAGLVFLSAATHPWPRGKTSWYYKLTARPVIGRLFVATLALPAGMLRIGRASTCVFSPNKLPEDYTDQASIRLVLRPSAFRANGIDVEGLYRHTVATAPRYGEIGAPTVVISGDRDTVVYEEVHSKGLARDIPGAELVWVRNLGHKPDWIAPELTVAAIERVSGRPVDLDAVARLVELRIADDAFASEFCQGAKPPLATQAAE
ncbi:MAG TPA: alpha/beta hydrolase [Rhizobiaceae bacterium]|nr:alpha/beta hydrolase [Rhizobiaceae bacterium]